MYTFFLIRLISIFTACLLYTHAVLAENFTTQCNLSVENSLSSAAMQNSVKFDKNITGHPLASGVNILVPTSMINTSQKLIACIRWRPEDTKSKDTKSKDTESSKTWTGGLLLHVIKSESNVATVNLDLPDEIEPEDRFRWWWPTPAQVRLIVLDKDKDNNYINSLDAMLDLRITSHRYAWICALLGIVLIWGACTYFANSLKIPGNWFLKVISDRQGYASLSQFQIMLWTLVVGFSAIYVMVLLQKLIDIEPTMLTLLGFAGGATVLAKLNASVSTGSGDELVRQLPPPIVAPGVIVDLQLCDKSGDSQVVLAWKPPVGGGKPERYIVSYQPPGGAAAITKQTQVPFILVNGLIANQNYDFQVSAENAAGAGATRQVTVVTAASPSSSAPNQVQGIYAETIGHDKLKVKWTSLPTEPDCYVVLQRPAGTTQWIATQVAAGTEGQCIVNRLTPDTDYEFMVFSVKEGQRSVDSIIASGRTRLRTPRFSDLLESDEGGEIDVARVQMLFFTLIAATFVIIKVVSSQEIPEIPTGILLLMGISNGVYLAAKYTGARN